MTQAAVAIVVTVPVRFPPAVVVLKSCLVIGMIAESADPDVGR
jgi:hypothetical protein